MLRTKAADPAAVSEASTIQIEVVRFAKEAAVGSEYQAPCFIMMDQALLEAVAAGSCQFEPREMENHPGCPEAEFQPQDIFLSRHPAQSRRFHRTRHR